MSSRLLACLTLLVASAALLLPGTAAAQTSGISGEVTDETGGVLPGVVVSATSPAQIDTRTAVTDGEGRYTLVSLQVGDYAVEFRSGPRNLDSGLSEISIVFQAAVPKPVAPKYTTSGVRRPSEL